MKAHQEIVGTQGRLMYGKLCHKSDYTQTGCVCQSFMNILFSIFQVLCNLTINPEKDSMGGPFRPPMKHLDGKLCLALIGDMQVVVGQGGDAPSPGRPGQEAQLHQVGLIYILQSDGFLADGGGQGL